MNRVSVRARMKIEAENFDGGIVRLKLAGDMDAQAAEEVDAKLMDYACAHRSVVVDMNAVAFLASMGIRTLVLMAKTVSRRGGKMAMLNPNANVTKALETARINDLI